MDPMILKIIDEEREEALKELENQSKEEKKKVKRKD